MKKKLILCLAAAQGLFLFSACEGPTGPEQTPRISPLAPTAWTEAAFNFLDNEHYYTFEAEESKYYTVRVNERGGPRHGDGTKTARVSLSLSNAKGDSLVSSTSGGNYPLPSPASFTGYTGVVYVRAGRNGPPGSYGISYEAYSPGDYPPAYAPEMSSAGIPGWGDSYYPVVSWKAVPGATGYRLYRSTSSGSDYAKVGSDSAGLSGTDTSAATSRSYYYKVFAFNSHGEGPQSAYWGVSTPSAAPGGGAPSPSALNAGVWAEDTLSSGASHWYSFSAASGRVYWIQDDDIDRNGGKTADVVVSAYTAGGKPLFYRADG
jgi:hypothetical protein